MQFADGTPMIIGVDIERLMLSQEVELFDAAQQAQ
jgi:hypothetical protein